MRAPSACLSGSQAVQNRAHGVLASLAAAGSRLVRAHGPQNSASARGERGAKAYQVAQHWAATGDELQHGGHHDAAGEQQPDGLQQALLRLAHMDGPDLRADPLRRALEGGCQRLRHHVAGC